MKRKMLWYAKEVALDTIIFVMMFLVVFLLFGAVPV